MRWSVWVWYAWCICWAMTCIWLWYSISNPSVGCRGWYWIIAVSHWACSNFWSHASCTARIKSLQLVIGCLLKCKMMPRFSMLRHRGSLLAGVPCSISYSWILWFCSVGHTSSPSVGWMPLIGMGTVICYDMGHYWTICCMVKYYPLPVLFVGYQLGQCLLLSRWAPLLGGYGVDSWVVCGCVDICTAKALSTSFCFQQELRFLDLWLSYFMEWLAGLFCHRVQCGKGCLSCYTVLWWHLLCNLCL